MRLILKPLGVLLILAALAALAAAALLANKKAATPPVVVVKSSPTENVSIPVNANVQGVPLIPAGSSQWTVVKTPKGEGSIKLVPVTNAPGKFDQALQVTVTKGDEKEMWAVQATRKVPFLIPAKWTFALRFWARSPQSGVTRVVLENNSGNYDKELMKDLTLTPDWKQYALVFTTAQAHPAEQTQISFQTAKQVGVCEFSQVELVDLQRQNAK